MKRCTFAALACLLAVVLGGCDEEGDPSLDDGYSDSPSDRGSPVDDEPSVEPTDDPDEPDEPDPAPAAGSGLGAGHYTCYSSTSGNIEFDVNDESTYTASTGETGNYVVDPTTGHVDFTSGFFADYLYGGLQPDGGLGLTGEPERSFYAFSCDLA